MQPIPQGSKIQVDFDASADKLILPQKQAGAMKYGIGLIISLLSFIALTVVHVLYPKPALVILLPLLLATIAFLSNAIRRVLQSPIPETITLSTPYMRYDSGRPAYNSKYSFAMRWNFLFPKRQRLEISPEQLRTLELLEHDLNNRLTVAIGLKRIEIGKKLSNIERVWLYGVIREKYGLPTKKGNV